MGTLKKYIYICMAALAICAVTPKESVAATRLTPMHLYTWARRGDLPHLRKYQRYINLQDRNKNTALCLAQQRQDATAYALLLKFGASTKVSCHDDNDPVCAIIAGEKTKIKPAAWWLLGLGTAAGAYALIHNGSKDDPQCPAGYIKGLDDCSQKEHPSGWNYISSGKAGTQNCGRCEPKTCQAGSLDCDAATTGFILHKDPNGEYAGDNTCYSCTYTCDTGYFANETECKNSGYICTFVEQAGVKCWKRTGSEQCPVEYPYTEPCQTGTGYTNGQTSKQVGFETCYNCNYQCDTANGWKDGECPRGLTCQTITMPNSNLCYKRTGCSAEFSYTSQATCEEGGYICEESYAGSGCWKRINIKECPATYIRGVTNCNDKTYPSGWTYTSSGVSGGEVCGKCEPKLCRTGYNYSSVTACGSQGANGWLWELDTVTPYGGDNICGKCTAKKCSDYAGGTAVPTVDQCTPYSHLTPALDINAVGYAGETPCYRCTYTCKQSYYTTESECKAGGFTCESVTENGVTCWIQNGSEDCPSTYPEKGSCPAAQTGYRLTSSSSTTVGHNTCYKCNYACDTANGWELRTSCPVGRTCSTVALPYNAGTCYKPTGCSTDYPYTSKASCEEGGYICTESYTGSGCWKRGDPSDCPTGYNTAYQSVNDCSPTQADGYNYTSSGTSGGLKCGKCTPKVCRTGYTYSSVTTCGAQGANGWKWTQDNNPKYAGAVPCGSCEKLLCSRFDSGDLKGVTSVTECPVYTGMKAAATNAVGYTGDDVCYRCSYTCASDAFDNEEDCKEGGYTCSSKTVGSLTCWYHIGTPDCPTGYTKGLSDCSAQTHPEGWTYTSSGSSGGQPCGKCTEKTCATGYDTAYTSVNTCGTTGAEGYTYTSSGYAGNNICGKCTPKVCRTGYTYSSVTACGAQGANGWSWTQDNNPKYAGTTPCGSCSKLLCSRFDSGDLKGVTSVSECPVYTGMKAAATNAVGYTGDDVCYRCSYTCASDAYDNEADCKEGGYTCSSKTVGTLTCWYHIGTPDCPTGYTKGLSDCSGKTYPDGWSYTSSGSSGGQPCGKCTEKACATGYDTSYTSVNSCGTTGSEGYTYTSSGHSGDSVCGKCTPKVCRTGYTYSSVTTCGAQGANGWKWTQDNNPKYTGTTPCGSCEKLLCSRFDSGDLKGVTSVAECPTYTGTKAAATNAVGYTGDDVCYRCSYTCATDAFDNEEDCKEGGYTCTSTTVGTLTCWYHTGTPGCPTGYTKGLNDCSAKTHPEGWTYTSSGSSGGEVCGKCTEKTCATGYDTAYTSVTSCGTTGSEGYTYTSSGYAGNNICGKCTPKVCRTGYTYSSVTACGAQGANGWSWTQDNNPKYAGTTPCGSCSKLLCSRFDSGDLKGVTSVSECPVYTGMKAAATNAVGYTGDDVCYRCSYTCASDAYDNEADCKEGGYTCSSKTVGTLTCWYHIGTPDCPTGYTKGLSDCSGKTYPDGWSYTSSGSSGGQPCGKCTEKACATGYSTSYTSVNSCGTTGSDGYTYTSSGHSGNSVCGKCTPKVCRTGYTYSSVTACGAQGANGWSWTQDNNPKYAGTTPCGSCSKLLCSRFDSGDLKGVTSVSQCPTYTGMKAAATNAVGYTGDDVCYRCSYTCATDAFDNEADCKAGGYTCSSTTVGTLTCWYQTGTPDCPTGYTKGLSNCSAKTHPEGWTYTSSGSSGGQPCGKCTEKTCTTGYSTSYTSVNSCGTTGSEGYTYTSSGYAGNNICGKCTAKVCRTGYTYSSVTACGAQGANGWSWTQDNNPKYAGTTPCGSCSKLLCSRFDSGDLKGVTSVSQCPTYTGMKAAATNAVGYTGDDVCYRCSYTCATDAFDNEADCKAGGYTCSSTTVGTLTCWYQTGTTGCPTGYTKGLANCSAKTHPEGWNYTSSGSSGGQVCGKCTEKTCTTGYSTSYSSVNSCGTTGSEGYTYTSSGYAGNSICGKCTAKVCRTGYTYSSVTACGAQGANGWTWSADNNPKYAGTTPCGSCSKLLCSRFDSGDLKGVTSVSQCPTYTGTKASATNAVGYTGDDVCYRCSYTCATDAFDNKADCEEGGYTCSSSTVGSLTCWYHTGSTGCATGYTKGLSDCSAKTHPEGWTYTSSGASGGQVCGKCTEKACTTGYSTSYSSVTSCGTTGSEGYTYTSSGYSGNSVCGKCTAKTCRTGYTYSSVTACGSQGANGWTWTQDTNPKYAGTTPCGSCSKLLCSRFDSGLLKGVTSVSQCTTFTGMKAAATNAVGYTGDDVCYRCSYTCATDAFDNKADCEEGGYTCSSSTVGTLTCWYQTGSTSCATGYTKGLTNCSAKTHPEGWSYTTSGSSGGQVCGKCTEKTCTSGYSTSYTSVSSCGTTGADGYTYTSSGYAGNSVCGKCTAKVCATGYTYSSVTACGTRGSAGWSWTQATNPKYAGTTPCGSCSKLLCSRFDSGDLKGVTNVSQCSTYSGMTVSLSSAVGYTGDDACYRCSYSCASDAFTTESNCTSGGYTCSSASVGSLTCWYRTGSTGCPTGYTKGLTSCSGQTHPEGWNYTSSGSSGGQTCGKCTEKTCTSGYSTSYSSVSSCGTTGADGYTYTSSGYAGNSICGKCTAKTCATGYTYSSVTACGSQGANGWTWTQASNPKYAGTTPCGSCSKLSCSRFDSGLLKGVTSVSECTTFTGMKAAATNSVGFTGDDICYRCSYTCKVNYSDQDDCEWDTDMVCASTTVGSLTCWYPTTTPLSVEKRMILQNSQKIEKTTSGDENVVGIKTSSDFENAVDSTTGEAGEIIITHNSTGEAVGIKVTNQSEAYNREGASINIANNNGGTATGIYVEEGSKAVNEGEIKITGETGTAYGIYGEGKNTIINEESGTIDVSGTDAYGIYVKDGSDTYIENAGTIKAQGENAHGIYVDENSDNTKVINTGEIYLNSTSSGDAGITLNGGELRNKKLVSFDGEADLNTINATFYLEDGGVYKAESLEGDLNVGTSNVLGGNKDVYVNENSLQADNIDNLSVISESAMFEAHTESNDEGNNNVVLERKNFGEFASNDSVTEYLEQNYKAGNMEEMYDNLKLQSSQPNVSEAIAKDLGYDVLPNFAQENYTALKSLNRNISDSVLEPTDEINRITVGGDALNIETKNKGLLSGYELNVGSVHTFGDKRLDNNRRLGLGLSITNMQTNYDTDGDRKLNIYNVFVPYLHKFTDNLRLASIVSVGYGDGEYSRSNNKESDISDIFYGWTNELRYTMDLRGFAELEPALMLNALGYTEDGFDEGSGADALETQKTHNMSVETGVGLFLKKKVSLERYGKLGFKAGGAYYREQADQYDDIEARQKGATGWYKMNDYANIYDHDRAVLEAAIDYEFKRLSIYAKYNHLIERNDPKVLDLGVKYNF